VIHLTGDDPVVTRIGKGSIDLLDAARSKARAE
jgi:hypothetical protein